MKQRKAAFYFGKCAIVTLAFLGLLSMGGCPIPGASTSAEIINDTEATIRVRVFYDDEQDIPRELLEEVGNETEFDLAPGESRTVSRDCDELQAILVHGEQRLIGSFGPEESSDVFRDGDDFGCGDLLTFRFTQGILPTNLNISVTLP